MPLQFVFGPSGSGKSHYLYQHIIEESGKHPEQSYIVLVPEQFTMQTQKDLVSMHPNHGIMNIDVLSFGRLAYRVFEETGGGELPVLDDEGKNLILRKIAGDYESQLKVLRGNMKKLGYISEVKSVISEFTQYDIGEEELERVMERAGEGSRLYYKLRDIGILYRGFQDYLEKKYITKEELLDHLSRVAGKSELLKNSTIVLDGFTGFTPVQSRLMLELMKCCRKVMVTAVIDEREDPFTYSHPYQLFGLSKHMVTGLLHLAKEAAVEVEDPVRLFGHPVYRFRENEELAFLEKNLFRYGKKTFGKVPESVEVHVARSPREEAYACVSEIRKMVRTRGYRYREIGVIVSNMDVYGDYLKQAFETYQIPFFMDHKRSILLNSFVEYIRSLLGMAEENFSYESVFRFLRTDMAGMDHHVVDRMENYVLGLGIRGYKRWQEKWIRKMPGMTEEELEDLNHYRVILVEKVDDLLFVLRQRKKTVRDITQAVYGFMVKEELQKKLKKQEELFQENGELALAKEYAQVYRIMIDLFDKFVELLGEEEVSLSEYCTLLEAGLEEARVGVIPPSMDQVVAGDVERTRLKDIKALFLIGANDTQLPGTLLRTGLLSEQDREKFAKEKLELAPGGKEKTYIQKFYLYMNLTKPSEAVRIFYSKVSSDGKSVRPSYLIQELKKLYPKLTVIDEEEKGVEERELTESLGIDELIKGLKQTAIARGMKRQDGACENQQKEEKIWKELYGWYRQFPEWKEKLEQILDAVFFVKKMDALDREVAKRLYGERFENSISRMERFSACAYAHYLAYGLRLAERKVYEFQPMDMGNVCHRALEHFSGKLAGEGLDWTQVSEELRCRYIDESVEEAIADYENSVLYSSARNEYLIVRMKRMLERTVWALSKQLAAGDFRPAAYELRFAEGKIDRVDDCEDGDKIYVKVMDYKTGSKAFDMVALYHGLQMQLMVYLNAAVKWEKEQHPEKEVVPAGVFYYRIQDPFVEAPKEKEEVETLLLKELKPDGMINLQEEVLLHLDRNQKGESLAVPVKYNLNGSLGRGSKAVAQEAFQTMMDYAVQKAEEIRGKIASGDVRPSPYRRGKETACDYCRYRHICGFDSRLEGYQYLEIESMNQEEVLANMQKDVKETEKGEA